MSKYLVIVESPAKAKTINKFLGTDYVIKASMGHVIDLPRKTLGVDIEHDFTPQFSVLSEKVKTLKELQAATKKAEKVFLATDPDREGETIGWHLQRELSGGDRKFYRVTFHEITKSAVESAFHNPSEINIQLVEAQQARRILDRLVGYMVSPLLWKRVGKGLSAGRVQSVALRLICEREQDIAGFKPEEYWSLVAMLLTKKNILFKSELVQIDGKKPEIATRERIEQIVAECQKEKYTVRSIEKKEKHRYPTPPFTTSTLQQAAFRQMGFTADRTMRIAQQLYEGVEIGEEGPVGLITYMRTDSVKVSAESQSEARKYIAEKYGQKYLPETPPHYKSKKGAQEAHEAIRPTSVFRTPESIAQYMTRDQLKLYRIIWNKFVASQTMPALFAVTTVNISAGPKYLFRATGSVVLFKGFLAVYEEMENNGEDDKEKVLPEMSEGENLTLKELTPEQHFTLPPPRFTDALLVKALEEDGIGRPSTYAPTIITLIARRYVERLEGKLVPTNLGKVVAELLVKHFPDIFNVEFTASMEEELDKIEEGGQSRVEVLKEFYHPFKIDLAKAETEMKDVKKQLEEKTNEVCEKCNSPMVIKWGRFGRFMACSNFPKCRNTKPISTGVTCPRPGCNGQLLPKRSKRGRTFFGCSNYPKCNFLTPDQPLAEKCPKCQAPILVRTRRGKRVKCIAEGCGYEEERQ